MHLNGTNQSVKITLRNPLDHNDLLDYYIRVYDNPLAHDWYRALKEILILGNQLEKNFCFLGFPKTARNLDYLCRELNLAKDAINIFFDDYQITETYTPETLKNDLDPNQDLLNILHNHFERLQGTVEHLSNYYKRADYNTKYAIRQVNNLCHEIESLLISQRRNVLTPEWVRPSQITTFLQVKRYELTDEHRELFTENGYNRKFGHVYMHWTQIGKTLFEVFRDEEAPILDATTCEAITALKYYSGEFDIDWGKDIVYGENAPWHDQEQNAFRAWLKANGLNSFDKQLSLGYLPIGEVDLESSFGTTDQFVIRDMLGNHLDIFRIQVDDVMNTFDYCWTDSDYKQRQIDRLKVGYDYSSRR